MIFNKLIQFFKHENKEDSSKTNRLKWAQESKEEMDTEFDPMKRPIAQHSKYDSVEFLNKYCTLLDDFIINDEINEHDLEKLADLNRITIDINSGWYQLVLELIKELHSLGWNKRVTCIKEKYASLRFYTEEDFHDILEKYEQRSEQICELCGEQGKIRYGGWDKTLCRIHYLENKKIVTVDADGFTLKGKSYKWSDVNEIRLDGLDHLERYKRIEITFQENILPKVHDDELIVFNSSIGFGKLLQALPIEYKPANFKFRNYIKDHFSNAEFCEICGYEAVYYDECECCEEDTWIRYSSRWKDGVYTEETYIKYHQMSWILDEGDKHEAMNPHYSMNPKYKLLFTEEELEQYRQS